MAPVMKAIEVVQTLVNWLNPLVLLQVGSLTSMVNNKDNADAQGYVPRSKQDCYDQDLLVQMHFVRSDNENDLKGTDSTVPNTQGKPPCNHTLIKH